MNPSFKTIRNAFVGVGKFMLVERVISVLTRCVDGLIIGLIIAYPGIENLWWIFLSTSLLNFIFCSLIVIVIDSVRLRFGIDLTGLEDLRKYVRQNDTTFKRVLHVVLSGRRTIFWIGSWFYLDPDYVTLILRDTRKSVYKDICEITAPSVFLAMIIWVPVYWILCYAFWAGTEWAGWLINL